MSDIQSGFEPPVGSVPPARKGSKVWIFAGVGCLLVSLLCLGAVGIVGYLGVGVAAEMTAAQDSIVNSPTVQAELGAPLEIQPPAQSTEGGQVVLTGDVNGPDGSGKYRIVFVQEGASIKTKEITVDANGKRIVVGDELSEIEEELGDLESELEGVQ